MAQRGMLSQTAVPTRVLNVARRHRTRLSVRADAAEATADAIEKSPRSGRVSNIVVLGGNGFVGAAVCKAALAAGLTVTSINRSGAPNNEGWTQSVTWRQCSASNVAGWNDLLPTTDAVISCVGGFDVDDSRMEQLNGGECAAAAAAAAEAGVQRFVMVSVHDYNLPEPILRNGYFMGKRRAEAAVINSFEERGVILRPGFIYGDRTVPTPSGPTQLPLGLIGKPLEEILTGQLGEMLKPLSPLPLSALLLTPPISVEAVAAAAVKSAVGTPMSWAGFPACGVFDVEGVKRLSTENVW